MAVCSYSVLAKLYAAECRIVISVTWFGTSTGSLLSLRNANHLSLIVYVSDLWPGIVEGGGFHGGTTESINYMEDALNKFCHICYKPIYGNVSFLPGPTSIYNISLFTLLPILDKWGMNTQSQWIRLVYAHMSASVAQCVAHRREPA